ncbi:Reverse transcriptase (RNA-dependent DNA polymerase) [Popillia japonica]|uniref:Reverse transcriptase (RNA-dependent DNA polymerase) n=1 Tax=Popillia japonica TaxID=7064 RepID=A0AAW1IZ92_POPJA
MTTKKRTYNEEQKKQFIEKVDQYDWGSINCYSAFHTVLHKIMDETFPHVLDVEENQQHIQTANRFNDYYVNIGNTKQANIKKEAEGEESTQDDLYLVGDHSPKEPFLSFEATNEDAVTKIIEQLKTSSDTSPDAYGLTVELLKLISDKVSGTIAKLVNKSFQESIFPEELKLTAILPHENVSDIDHDRDDPANSRPVGIVPVLSKIFEDIVVFQLRQYFEKTNLFAEEQHGHRTGRNTVSAILSMLEATVSKIKEEQSTVWSKVSGTIAKLVNKSFQESIFPEELKLTAILPHENVSDIDHDRDDPANSRPVGIVPVLSKIFEDIVVFQLRQYFEKTNLFAEEQHGHRTGRNTVSAILSMLEATVSKIKEEQSVRFTIYDLSEAYNSVDHQILLKKIRLYGVGEEPVKYLDSYLTGRSQFVRRFGCQSDTKYINVGIPQGCKLAPFLFAVYINDLPSTVSGSIRTIMYVDDVAFITPYQEDDLRIAEKLNEDVNMWLGRNLLQLEANKIQHLLIPHIKPIRIESVKFVNVVLSNDLSWSEHINYLVEHKLASAKQSIQDKASQNVSFDILRDTYINEFHCYFTKDILLWGHSEEANIIFEKQKEVISILQPGEDSIKSKFNFCNVLTVPALYIRSCLLHAHTSSERNIKLDLEIYRIEPKYTVTHLYNALWDEIRAYDKKDFRFKISSMLAKDAIFTVEEYLMSVKRPRHIIGPRRRGGRR